MPEPAQLTALKVIVKSQEQFKPVMIYVLFVVLMGVDTPSRLLVYIPVYLRIGIPHQCLQCGAEMFADIFQTNHMKDMRKFEEHLVDLS